MLQRSISISVGTASIVGAGGLIGAYWTGGFEDTPSLSVRGALRNKANYPRKEDDITPTGFTDKDYTRTEVFWRSKANFLTMRTNHKKADWVEALREDLGSQWKEYLETDQPKANWYFKDYGKAARAILEWCEYYAEKDKGNVLREAMDKDLCNFEKNREF